MSEDLPKEALKTVIGALCAPATTPHGFDAQADRWREEALKTAINRTRDEERARRLGEHPRALPPGPQPATPGPIDPLAPTAVRNCAHCDQPVTIVALLATQEAARPTITNRVTDIAPLRRLQ